MCKLHREVISAAVTSRLPFFTVSNQNVGLSADGLSCTRVHGLLNTIAANNGVGFFSVVFDWVWTFKSPVGVGCGESFGEKLTLASL
jgi:hypothetical protein